MAKHHRLLRLLSILFALFLLLLSPTDARADIAPPETPPGGNPSPGGENTQVRMLSETVTLVVRETPSQGSLGQAQVTAVFDMQNTGSVDEQMQVRFPLTFPNGLLGAFGELPEIADLQVKVDGRKTPTQRTTLENPGNSDAAIPWGAFEATFPAGKTVRIEVTYLEEAWGEYSYIVFGYVLETGAGWHGTIGNAKLIVRLPYGVNEQNVFLEGSAGFGRTSPGAEIVGDELHWQRSDFEPEFQDNLSILMLSPAAWKKILAERERTSRNPQDGEAWGRLGKACKEASRLRRGVREDAGGQALYQESLAAYEKSVALLPEDALWHFGHADLLWNHYYYHVYIPYEHDQSELVRTVQELKASLDLEPDDPRALDLAQEIAWLADGIIDLESDPIGYPILTATPVYPAWEPAPVITEETAIPEPTPTIPPLSPTMTSTIARIEVTLTPVAVAQVESAAQEKPLSGEGQKEPAGQEGSPLCGGAFIPLLAAAAVLRVFSRKK